MLKRLSFLLLATGLAVGLAVYWFFYWLVVFAPGEEIRQSSIEKILAVESPVMYSGGKSKIGVFFETSHRQYVPYDEIPRDFINAIISAEDSKFFEHHGFDSLGVLRALWANIRAGRVVQGGSTITQQTAKNLFKRKNRSLYSKIKELLFALRLEYHYPKEKILEFYANQFYVSGNGRGLGVAARYYFDKEVDELDLLECAFIAGSVKRPNYYNPFIKADEDAKALARKRSKQRAGYVLRQMLKNELLTVGVYEKIIAREVPFEQGKMYFSLNTIMDLVKEALGAPEVLFALQEHGIDNVATSGIKIVTTIEKELQEESFTALRKELSRLDVRLRGYEREAVQEEYDQTPRKRNRDRGPGSFHFGRIVKVETETDPKVWVSISGLSDEPPDAYIDKKGLLNLLDSLVKYEKNRWTEIREGDLAELLTRLKVDDFVYISVREVDGETGRLVVDLEKYPQVQGGVLAMRDGKIRVMVGGKDNRYFNRALDAKRSMGSVVKPLVYGAALQLGWNTIDVLNNERDVFVYQNKPYFPRPDHQSPYSGVSMSWAGVHSENLATIWLLYHLCDRLTPGQFQRVVDYIGLGQSPGESDADYRMRIRDEHGIVVDEETYYEVSFEKAVAELEPDLIFAGRLDEYETVSKLHYGRNFDGYYSEVGVDLGLVKEDGSEVEIDEELELSDRERAARKKEVSRKKKEALLRKKILKKNFLRLNGYRKDLLELRSDLYEFAAGGLETEEGEITSLYRNTVTGDYIYFDKDEVFGEREVFEEQLELPGEQEEPPAGSGGFAGSENGAGLIPADWQAVGWAELALKLASFYNDQPLPVSSALSNDREDAFWDAVLLDNSLTAQTVGLIDTALHQEYQKLRDLDPYGPDFLNQVRDFRITVSLQYLIGLCRAIGIESELDPVLSFPLGSNVMSLFDVARAYNSILTGTIKRYGGPESGAGLAIIESISDSDGDIIYVPEPVETRVILPEIRVAASDILRRVVKFGTGRYADRNVRLRSKDFKRNRQLVELGAHVPLVGKTGTANRFTNASFAGGVPGVGEEGLFDLAAGYVLTTYVGFDDNEPMVRSTTHITGASGSLPLWSRIANRILLENDYASMIDLVDISFADQIEFPLHYPDLGQVEVSVDPSQGGLASIGENTGASLITFGESTSGGRLKPARFFKPYWQAGSD